jgi:alkylhydroperoxidase family enzyme
MGLPVDAERVLAMLATSLEKSKSSYSPPSNDEIDAAAASLAEVRAAWEIMCMPGVSARRADALCADAAQHIERVRLYFRRHPLREEIDA